MEDKPSLLLVAEPRSGSTLMMNLMSRWVDIKNLRDMCVVQNSTFDVNLNYVIYADLIPDFEREITMVAKKESNVVVFLSRRDKIAQGLSICRLHSLEDQDLRVFKKHSPETPEDFSNFSDKLLRECILSATWIYGVADRFISELNCDVLRLYYEDNLSDETKWYKTIVAILDLLCVSYKDQDVRNHVGHIQTEGCKKVRGHLTDLKYKEFLGNFREDFKCP